MLLEEPVELLLRNKWFSKQVKEVLPRKLEEYICQLLQQVLKSSKPSSFRRKLNLSSKKNFVW